MNKFIIVQDDMTDGKLSLKLMAIRDTDDNGKRKKDEYTEAHIAKASNLTLS